MSSEMRLDIEKYCTKIGADPLLVQGAGGNISWKDGDTLWIKASGMWIADAEKKDIFVPVDLADLNTAIQNNNFEVTPSLKIETKLRPSIETLLHALLPHRVVVHLHAVEILAHLVRKKNIIDDLKLDLGSNICWVMVEYFKPGAELARVARIKIAETPKVNIIFLKNHGVVVGGEDIAEIHSVIGQITKVLSAEPSESGLLVQQNEVYANYPMDRYSLVQDYDVQQLALNPIWFDNLTINWALYPDHIVFLGAKPSVHLTRDNFIKSCSNSSELPELIFIKGDGVYARANFSQAKYAQLRCYYDVMARVPNNQCLDTLTMTEISDLLSWDAEHYRKKIG